MRDGKVYAEAIVLSHKEQLDRLAAATPPALDRAVVAGDPCFDRLVASTHLRSDYRARLGAATDSRVVLVSSTWGPNSLFGRLPDLISDLMAELTADDHVVVAALHPNVWFRHGPLQIRRWLADALRAGLRLVPPLRGWQQALLAADVVVGDHGAVTGYAAACGIPTVLATFPEQDVAPGSAIAEMGRAFPRLARRGKPFQDQLAELATTADDAAGVAALTTSVPHRSADLLRELFYRTMALDEPTTPALVEPYAPTHLQVEHRPATAFWLACTWTSDAANTTVEVRRWPAEVTARPRRGPRTVESHLAATVAHPRRDLRGATAVVLSPDPLGLADALATTPTAALAAATDDDGRCHLRYRDGTTATVHRVDGRPCDAVACGSMAYSRLRRHLALPPAIDLRIGAHAVRLTISSV